MQQEPSEARAALPRFFTLEMFMFTVAVLSGLVLMWNIVAKDRNVAVLLCAGAISRYRSWWSYGCSWIPIPCALASRMPCSSWPVKRLRA